MFKPYEAIEGHIADHVKRYAAFKHPAILERFVLRNGHVGVPAPRPKLVKKRKDKECFKNAMDFMMEGPLKRRTAGTYTYVEGLAMRLDFGMLIHHAWVEDEKHNVLDLTWREPETALYYGVPFTLQQLVDETSRTGVYGLLDTGMYNVDLMFRIDPALKDIVETMIGERTKRRTQVQDQIEAA